VPSWTRRPWRSASARPSPGTDAAATRRSVPAGGTSRNWARTCGSSRIAARIARWRVAWPPMFSL